MITSRAVPAALGALAGAAAGFLAGRRWRAAPAGPPSVGAAFDRVNDEFHEHYGETRQNKADEVPIFVVLADTLVLRRGQQREAYSFAPRMFHLIKSVAHGPVALYAMLHRLGDAALDDDTRARLESLRSTVTDARRALDHETDEPDAMANLRTLLDRSADQIDRVLADGRVDPGALAAFARELGPPLLRSTDDATRVQLASLDAHVRHALASLGDGEKRAFQVIVTGDHQARARSLGMQYFTRLLGEREGEEHRVAYAEGVCREDEALALVGTRRLDHAIAAAFFGDEHRLQRDVLGDATEARLRDFTLPSLP